MENPGDNHNDNDNVSVDLPADLNYSPKANSIDVSKAQDRKLWKEIITPGEGDDTPCESMEVYVNYIGRFPDGSEFDSSYKRSEPFKFTLGDGSVIRGWDEGVMTMKKKEKALIVCHPEYAYGSAGRGEIPPNSTLYFEIELLSWKEEDLSPNQTGGILRRRVYTDPECSRYNNPNNGATVELHLEGSYDGKVFDNRDVKFVLGEGIEENIPEGLEKALLKFCPKEKSRITLQPSYGFGATGNSALGVPRNVVLVYNVELINFIKASEAWELNSQQKLESSREFKTKGTKHFSDGKYHIAVGQYKKIVDFLKAEPLLQGDEEVERKALLLAAHLNLSICYLKLEDYFSAKRQAEEALEMEPNNVKGLYRLGLSSMALNEHAEAKFQFQRVLQEDPLNKLATQQINICDKQIRLHREKEKQVFGNMFDKFARIDRKKEEAARMQQPNGLDNLDQWKKADGKKADETLEDCTWTGNSDLW